MEHTVTQKISRCRGRPPIVEHHCDFCNKTIKGGLFPFKAHLFTHNNVEPRFECNYCMKSYFRFDSYTIHMQKHEDKKRNFDMVYICDHCDRGFKYKYNLIKHLRFPITSAKFTCNACDVAYFERRSLAHHIRKTHFNMELNYSPSIVRKVNETWFEPVYDKKVCVQMTKVNSNVLIIKKCDSVKKDIYKPTKINKPEHNATAPMSANIALTNYSKVICDYCGKEMLKKSLINHIRERHLNLRKFHCKKCKCRFNRHYQLIDHVCGRFREKRRYHFRT